MKNEVRPIDANATIEALRANFQQGSWYGCEEPCYQIAEDTISEMPTLTGHFREVTKMVPLTLEQLREMIDQPAYLYIYDTALDSGWHIIKAVTEDKIIFRGWNTVYVPISSLGKCFDLYAYPPAHIDREAWTAEWVSNGNRFVCSRCGVRCAKESDETDYYPLLSAFCPSCGRAMTPGAWAELEKRMGVM